MVLSALTGALYVTYVILSAFVKRVTVESGPLQQYLTSITIIAKLLGSLVSLISHISPIAVNEGSNLKFSPYMPTKKSTMWLTKYSTLNLLNKFEMFNGVLVVLVDLLSCF